MVRQIETIRRARTMAAAAHALLDDVEMVARDSFATSEATFESDWQEEDPRGHDAWKALKTAVQAYEEADHA